MDRYVTLAFIHGTEKRAGCAYPLGRMYDRQDTTAPAVSAAGSVIPFLKLHWLHAQIESSFMKNRQRLTTAGPSGTDLAVQSSLAVTSTPSAKATSHSRVLCPRKTSRGCQATACDAAATGSRVSATPAGGSAAAGVGVER